MHLPDRYEQTSDGVYEQKEFVDPCGLDRGEDYEARAINILNVDLNHYTRHAERIRKATEGIKPEMVAAWGGGHPKLEVMTFKHLPIYVYDGAAEMYGNLKEEFYSRYGGTGCCWWTDCFVDADTIASKQEIVGLNTFCHVLEHQSWEGVQSWLRACTKPVLIYGPNIERARSDGWFHFRPPDHNTFATDRAMMDVLTERFDNVASHWIDEDYLICAY